MWRARPSNADTQATGQRAELAARRYLEGRGLAFVEANYRCRGGEIDLIMRDNDYLVFVEVRFRSHPHFGNGLDSVDHRKQRRLILAAQHYLQQLGSGPTPACRFDVVAVAPQAQGYGFDWITNAIEQ